MYKAHLRNVPVDAQTDALFDFTSDDRTNAQLAFETTFANKEDSQALFMLHQSLMSRYQALNGSPTSSPACAVFDFTSDERTEAQSAFEETFATAEDTQHV